MNKVITVLSTIIILAILSGCSTTDLSYKNNKLALQVDGKHLQMNGTLLDKHQHNFNSLYLEQNIVQLDAGNVIVYEKARTDNRYEFNFPALTTMQIVFDARSIRKIYFSSSFYVFQVILHDGRVLNAMLEQLEDQSMNIAYGMSNTQIHDMLRELDTKVSIPLVQNVITIHGTQGAIYSRWNERKVHFTPLIVPLREFGM